MKEQFVTYEIALKLKELGFNEPCLAAFVYKDVGYLTVNMQTIFSLSQYQNQTETTILAPLWQQCEDFLYINYDVQIERKGNGINYRFYIGNESFLTLELAILKAIELCQEISN